MAKLARVGIAALALLASAEIYEEMRLRCIEIYVFMVDDYGVDEMLCRLHAGDGVEIRRAAVDGLEMWLVVLGDDHRVLEHSLQAVLHFEV